MADWTGFECSQQEQAFFDADEDVEWEAHARLVECQASWDRTQSDSRSSSTSHQRHADVATQDYRPLISPSGLDALVYPANGSASPASQQSTSYPIRDGEPRDIAHGMGHTHFHNSGP